MKVVMFTPVPPARTGVAHYASLLIPALRERMDLTVVGPDDKRPATGDHAIYQLGNNPHHELAYREAMRNPGIIVLHDIVLHHLVVEMTLARGDAAGYVAAMQANHGDMGAAWARGRIIGLHDEVANFLMPASIDMANRSRAVIVHNQYAAGRLRSLGVTTPIHVVPHPYVPSTGTRDGRAIRRRFGIADDERVIGFFGFLTSAKRASVVLEAFAMARGRNKRLRLLVVGEPAPNMKAVSGEGITATGYVSDEELDAWYAAADRLVNLRYPSAGETSGTLIRAFDAGKPVAVSDYAQFAELPDDIVTKIRFGDDEPRQLADFFLRDIPPVAAAQRRWLEDNARIDLTVEGYMRALSGTDPDPDLRSIGSGQGEGRLGLFPQVSMAARREGTGLVVTLRNDGAVTLRAAEYGQPGYRAVLKLFDGEREVYDRWVALPRDLASGETTEITLPDRGERVRLYNGLEGVPLAGEEPDAEVEIGRVR